MHREMAVESMTLRRLSITVMKDSFVYLVARGFFMGSSS